jgi:uncharacterized membrane protein YqjE
MMASQYPGQQPPDERPLGELFSVLSDELQQLVRKEVELAKTELKDQTTRATKAAAMFGGMAVIGFLGSMLVSFALAWGLAEAIPAGLAFLAVGVLYLAVAGLLFVRGRKNLAEFRPVPEQTVQTLKEDVQVAKDSISRGTSA